MTSPKAVQELADDYAQRQAMQDDVAVALRALGLSDAARNASPHEVMTKEVIPEISRLRSQLSAAERLSMLIRDEADGIEKVVRRIQQHVANGATASVDNKVAIILYSLQFIRESCDKALSPESPKMESHPK